LWVQLLDQDEKWGAAVPQVRNTTGEGTGMNQETLKFINSGSTIHMGDDYEAEIHVVGEEVWLGRIVVYGSTSQDAEGLRDRLLWALNQPTVPAQWQRKQYRNSNPEVDPVFEWINLDNGGEAARLKGEGYEIRALYAKVPLQCDHRWGPSHSSHCTKCGAPCPL
jgi:hypothetical protein